MLPNPLQIKTIDEYISLYPTNVQKILQKVRQTIKKSAPKATEAMRYGIPTFRLQNKNLVHFGAFKEHIGFYPTPALVVHFAKELKPYKTTKGAIQFPLQKPIPYDLIKKITDYRVKELQKTISK